MTPNTISDSARRIFEEGLNRRDRVVFDALVAEDYVNHEAPGGIGAATRGPDNWLEVVERLGASFPDISWRVRRTVEEGDQVWVETTMSGTHKAMFFGFPPTGRHFEVRQIHLLRFADGLIREHSAVRDDLGVLIQLGLIESPYTRAA